MGKDNIPFHTIIWPAILLGHGDLDLPTNVPANQYVTFKGEKASKSAGVGRTVLEYLEIVQPDALRYAVACVLPEQNDTELTDDEIVRRVNDELVAVWGNLVNRVVSMIGRNFDGAVPASVDPQPADTELVANVDRGAQRGGRIDRGHRAAGRAPRRDGRGAVGQRLPVRQRAVEGREDRPRPGRHRPPPRAPGDRRDQRGALPVRPGRLRVGGEARSGRRPRTGRATTAGTAPRCRPVTSSASWPRSSRSWTRRSSANRPERLGRRRHRRGRPPRGDHPAGVGVRVRAARGAPAVDPDRAQGRGGDRHRVGRDRERADGLPPVGPGRPADAQAAASPAPWSACRSGSSACASSRRIRSGSPWPSSCS